MPVCIGQKSESDEIEFLPVNGSTIALCGDLEGVCINNYDNSDECYAPEYQAGISCIDRGYCTLDLEKSLSPCYQMYDEAGDCPASTGLMLSVNSCIAAVTVLFYLVM
eukprot:TRINITY_DN2035_c0_g2_i2.p1 TRINITY_DN2035_c0_g2~~TRINITY_DN2035_c0_g2_i2.p1  ORF type:complete len:108 (+),score=19.80 TRINITY_DN2035_c0_g2_i2:547-870(+)